MRSNTEKRVFWQNRIERCQTSGIPIKKWCEKNNVVYATFQYWKAKIVQNQALCEKVPVTRTSFTELIDLPNSDNSGVEIVIGKAIIRLRKGFDAATLKSCLCVLGG